MVFRITEEVLDVEDIIKSTDDLVVFYNIGTHSVQISNASSFSAKNITLYNVQGQEVLLSKKEYAKVNEITIPVSVATGTYLVRFDYNDGTMITKKLIIK